MTNPAKISKSSRYYQGVYSLKNPQKYMGDPTQCVYRSSLERKVFKALDENADVVAWKAEPFPIPYLSPKDGQWHRYFPDIIVKTQSKDRVKVTLIEIKPFSETVLPKSKGKRKNRYLNEKLTYEVNQAKWEAAKGLCKKKGWYFHVMTEKEINPQLPGKNKK